jgi:hypothetical protein
MKVLIIFVDMLRANRLSTFNESLKIDTPIDDSFKQLGGTIYRNCFTPGPDTPRGISSAITGIPPHINGCDVRLKWPRDFLKPEIDTIYDLFLEKKFKIDILSDPRERAVGLLPANISELGIHNARYDLDDYLENIVIEDDHFIFLCLPQFHWALDALGASKNAEKYGQNDVASAINLVFEKLDKDLFDHIIIFSDHGFKFTYEMKLSSDYMLLNDDRTHTVMIHRKKHQMDININEKLCSIADIYPTIQDILDIETYDGFSLFSNNMRNYIVVEDHISFLPSINQNIELWAVIDREYIYIRKLDRAILIDRQSQFEFEVIIDYYDNILDKESSFCRYKTEHDRIFVYSQNLLNIVGLDFNKLYKSRRKSRSLLISNFYKIKDLFIELWKNIFFKV